MTILTSIKSELSKHLTLKSIKNDTWLDYLEEETSYVNGTVYVNKSFPQYHNQRLDYVNFETNVNSTLCEIYLKREGFGGEQLSRAKIKLNGEELHPTISTMTNGLRITFPFNVNGVLDMDFPPVNNREECYRGLRLTKEVKSQNITITSLSISNNVLNCVVNVENPISNQELKYCILSDEGYGEFTVIELEDNKRNYALEHSVDLSTDYGLHIELVQYTSDSGVMYIGNDMEIYFD